MTFTISNKIINMVKMQTRQNWGFPFIVGFIALLLMTAVSLFEGFSFWANAFADSAFLVLIIGVLLQIVCFVKYRKSNGEND